jgi:phosphomannomutase
MSDTLMISVSGMRGHVGTDLTPELVARHAAALGAWVRTAATDSAGRRPAVVLGRDARTSGPMFARAASAGLMSVGVDVIDLGMVPTPTVQLAVEHHHAGGGLILTASHNPIEWNALKFVGPDGIFLDAVAGERVRALADQGPPRAGWDGIGEVGEDPEAVSRHLEAILRLPVIDVTAIRGRRFHVALDCVRGAGAVAILPLLDRLGCRVSGINLEPDGRFPRPPEPVPENLGELGRLVRESGADLGLAVDPDVDRLAVVDGAGRAIGEDYTLAFAVRAVLDGRSKPAKNPTVVVNLSTSLVVDDAARSVGATVLRAPVGEANVARAIRERGP